MHKTILAALIVGAGALSIPALAQVNLGGAAQVGAGVNTGAVVPNTMHAVDQTGAQTVHRVGHETRHLTHKAVDKTRSTVNNNGSANAGVNADGSAGAGAGNTHADASANVDADAGIDTANTAGKAGAAGQGLGGDVRDTAHSAIQATDRSAGSVGDAVKQTATGQSVGADAKVDAKAATHGH